MKGFQFKNPVDLHFGPGTAAEVGRLTAKYGHKAFVVTGQGSARRTGLLDRVTGLLAESGVKFAVFDEVTPNPLSTTVMRGVERLKAEKCDVVVGVGGGSPIDAAKAIALCSASASVITDYMPGGPLAEVTDARSLPVVALPTTAGTGTEIDRYLVITNAATNEKPGIGFDCTYPVAGIVDPELMVSVPAGVTVDTGLDVLYHAMEAFVSTGAHPFSDLLATEAIRLVVGNLERAVANGADLEARTALAWASSLAGWAIDMAGTVAIHAAGHPISGRLGATHGQSLAALAVTYMRHNHQANPPRFAELARLFGFQDPALSTEQTAARFADELKAFQARVGRDITAGSLGVTATMIPQLARDCFQTMSGALNNNPRPLSLEDVEKLYRGSL